MDNEAYFEEILAQAGAAGYPAALERLAADVRAGRCALTPQSCYYLACLAGGSGRAGDALAWLELAIGQKGWWYRPEVLDDDDLALLAGSEPFEKLLEKSKERWQAACRTARAEESWRAKTAENLLLAVHGNTQSAPQARQNWEAVTAALPGWQVETVLSGTVDGYGTRRWAYDDKNYREAAAAAGRAAGAGYARTAWGGFSAGCDMLLRTVARTPLRCDVLLLQSPWVPLTETADGLAAVCRALAEKNIRLALFCGTADEDCLPPAEALYAAALAAGVRVTLTRQRGLRHCFSENTSPLRAALCGEEVPADAD